MIKKMFNKIKDFVIEEYKSLLLILIVTIIITMPVPYYIITGGGISNINNRVVITDEYATKGSFNFSYVKEMKGTTLTYLYGKLFNKEMIKKDDVKLDNETIKDYELRDKLYLKESVNNATYVAYTLANKKITVASSDIKILYISLEADTNLKAGDNILSVDGVKFETLDEYKQIIQTKDIGDKVKVLVERDKKEVVCYAKVYQSNDQKILGLAIFFDKEYITDPKIKFNFKTRESGPSGGLMIALNIYNKLVADDITNGKKIVGTGAIDELGNVTEIGGIAYKLLGAVKAKCDVFIAPTGKNYQEVVELKEKNNYNILIIEAKTVEQVINELKNL